MGCFSYKCKISKRAANSNSFKGDAVYIFLLINGEVVEEMYGNYNSYGGVFKATKEVNDKSLTEYSSFHWNHNWGKSISLHLNNNENSGYALILAKHYNGIHPTTISEDDPEQGSNEVEFGEEVKKPYHKIY